MSEQNAKELKELRETVKKQNDQLMKLNDTERKAKVKETIQQFKEKGVPANVLNTCEAAMNSDEGSPQYYQFSEEADGKKIEGKRSLTEWVQKILDTVGTIEFAEETTTEQTGRTDVDPNKGNSVTADIKKYAEEHKMSFNEAYNKLSKANKFNEVQVVAG